MDPRAEGRRFMIELYSGSGTVARAFRARGWDTLTVDTDERCKPDIVCDVRGFRWVGRRPHFVWASPPCTTFSLAHYLGGRVPSGADWPLVQHTRKLILSWRPEYWLLENVAGLVRYWPDPALVLGPWFFWGHFPPFHYAGPVSKGLNTNRSRSRMYRRLARTGQVLPPRGPRSAAKRATIPVEIVTALLDALDNQLPLFGGSHD